MNTLLIQVASNPADVSGMDELLWRVLWQPIGLPRQVRRRFLVAGEQIELVAKQDDRLVGGLVAAKTADAEIELRHLAVSASERGRGIGRRLVEALIREAASRGCNRVHTIARNYSAGFFRKLGFRPAAGVAPEHPAFARHGITFELMEMMIESAGTGQARPGLRD